MVRISQFANLIASRLWDKYLTWAADGRSASFFLSRTRTLNYQISDALIREGRERALAMVQFSVTLEGLNDDERAPRASYLRDRSIHHAYEITATTEYCDSQGKVVARRRDTVGFDRNPTGAEINSALSEAAEARLGNGTDPAFRRKDLEVCSITITEAWRKTS